MVDFDMKRVLVIGCPGSGKSTFALKISEITQISLYHLDLMNWNKDKTCVSLAILLERISKVMLEPTWIIDGNYGSSLEMRVQGADTIFFLDYDVELCVAGIQNRVGKKRIDMPWVETEIDDEFMDFIKNFSVNSRPDIIKLLQKYPSKKWVVFKERSDADDYLAKITNEF